MTSSLISNCAVGDTLSAWLMFGASLVVGFNLGVWCASSRNHFQLKQLQYFCIQHAIFGVNSLLFEKCVLYFKKLRNTLLDQPNNRVALKLFLFKERKDVIFAWGTKVKFGFTSIIRSFFKCLGSKISSGNLITWKVNLQSFLQMEMCGV